jgi:ATP-dependent Clp protease protease subunit
MSKKFWNWVKNEETNETELIFNGPISEESWFGDEITPALFRDELAKISGNLTVWLNSPGGDCLAASQIYTMLRNHKGKVTVKIDGIAASAASVVAMAGDETLISPTGYLIVHNPATIAMGNRADMEKAIDLLDEIKEGIINAYEEKSGLSRAKIAHMMDEETWLNAKKALNLGFVDGILFAKNEPQKKPESEPEEEPEQDTPEEDKPEEEEEPKEKNLTAMSYSSAKTMDSLMQKLSALYKPQKGTPIDQLEKRLALLKR